MLLVAGVTAILITLLTACGGKAPQAPGMMFGSGPVAVMVTEVTARNYVDRFTALGTARANESIDVTSRISSVVTAIRFEEGQRVATGDMLIELDNAEIRAQLTMAEASISGSTSPCVRCSCQARRR